MPIPVLTIPKNPVEYKPFKARMLKNTLLVSGLLVIFAFFVQLHWALYLFYGAFLGYGYLFSLFYAAEAPKRKLSAVLSIGRMAIVSFLIAWAGQFQLLETCVVFCGFLSYKVVLLLEFVRYSVGIKPSRVE